MRFQHARFDFDADIEPTVTDLPIRLFENGLHHIIDDLVNILTGFLQLFDCLILQRHSTAMGVQDVPQIHHRNVRPISL
jgi:hypothetical protein